MYILFISEFQILKIHEINHSYVCHNLFDTAENILYNYGSIRISCFNLSEENDPLLKYIKYSQTDAYLRIMFCLKVSFTLCKIVL